MESDPLATAKQVKSNARLLFNDIDDLCDQIFDLEQDLRFKNMEIEKLRAEIERLKPLVPLDVTTITKNRGNKNE